MFFLSGKISDFIHGGKLPKDVHVTNKLDRTDPPPASKLIKNARGKGLGKGATRGRSGPGAE